MPRTYAELCENFAIDSKLLPRNKWRRVTLEKTKGQVTLPQWRRFRINLEQALEQGEPPSDADLRKHILQELTPVLREAVLRHERAERKRQFWVKVTLPTGMDEDTFLEKVQETLGAAYPRYCNVARTHDRLLFDCGSEMARTRFFSLSGLVHDDFLRMVNV